jgi:hypothetical protein
MLQPVLLPRRLWSLSRQLSLFGLHLYMVLDLL